MARIPKWAKLPLIHQRIYSCRLKGFGRWATRRGCWCLQSKTTVSQCCHFQFSWNMYTDLGYYDFCSCYWKIEGMNFTFCHTSILQYICIYFAGFTKLSTLNSETFSLYWIFHSKANEYWKSISVLLIRALLSIHFASLCWISISASFLAVFPISFLLCSSSVLCISDIPLNECGLHLLLTLSFTWNNLFHSFLTVISTQCGKSALLLMPLATSGSVTFLHLSVSHYFSHGFSSHVGLFCWFPFFLFF